MTLTKVEIMVLRGIQGNCQQIYERAEDGVTVSPTDAVEAIEEVADVLKLILDRLGTNP